MTCNGQRPGVLLNILYRTGTLNPHSHTQQRIVQLKISVLLRLRNCYKAFANKHRFLPSPFSCKQMHLFKEPESNVPQTKQVLFVFQESAFHTALYKIVVLSFYITLRESLFLRADCYCIVITIRFSIFKQLFYNQFKI